MVEVVEVVAEWLSEPPKAAAQNLPWEQRMALEVLGTSLELVDLGEVDFHIELHSQTFPS